MTIINALPFNLQNGTTADATQVMADFNEIVNDVNNNAAHNGVNTDITALTGLTTPITPAQGGSTVFYGAGSGTANAQTVPSVAPTGFALTVGWSIYWVPANQNTGALTLSVNGGAATAVLVQTESGPQPCIGGEVIGGQLTKATFDGTQFILDMDMMVGFGTLATLSSATTTDIGTARSHTVNISGTTTITAFGSSALAARPLYKLVFSGTLVLTYNATSLILPGSANITTANGDSADALYLGSGNWQITSYYKRTGVPVNFNPTFIQNYISGLTLSAAGSTGTFGIAAGEATDSTNASVMLLNSAYTKTTASWAVGSGNGGLDTSAIANTTWYHVFEIQRVDTGVVDILFSLSATAPTMPTNYTLFRRIGSMKTDASAHWLAFTQIGDEFVWAAQVAELSAQNNNGARVLLPLNGVPTGVIVMAHLRLTQTNGAGGAMVTVITSPFENDVTPSAADGDMQANTSQFSSGNFDRLTDTSARFGFRTSSANGTVSGVSYGWRDYRGKN